MWFWLACTIQTDWAQEFSEDPEQVIHTLASKDEIERTAVIMNLIELFPQDSAKLCALLEADDAQKRCFNIASRPHLWSDVKSKGTARIEQSASADLGCDTDAMFVTCVEKKTHEAIRQGNIEKVKQLCAQIKSDKWHSECLFQAAEQSTRHRGAHGYSEGVELCLSAGDFSENCQNHLIMILAKRAPTAHSREKSDWAPIESASNALRAAWSWRDRSRLKYAQERLWSEALGMAYAGLRPVTGDPLDVLGADKQAHVHSALTRRLMQIDAPSSYKLSTWLELALRCRASRASKIHSRDIASRFQAAADLWEEDDAPSIAYMATSRRLYSPEVEIDMLIALLEAAARIPPAHLPLLEEGAQHAHPMVQKTAKRLLSKVKTQEQ